RQDLDVGDLFDPSGQVTGHILMEVVAANDEQHLAATPGKEDCGLPGRVAATHEHHLCAAAHLCFSWRRRVVDPSPFKLLFAFHAQSTVVDSGCDQEALGGDGFFAVEMHDAIGFVERQMCHRRGNCNTGTELVRLKDSAVSQLTTRHTGG